MADSPDMPADKKVCQVFGCDKDAKESAIFCSKHCEELIKDWAEDLGDPICSHELRKMLGFKNP